MKIAIITFEYPPFIIGGAGIYVDNISKELAKLGNDVTIITPQMENEVLYEKVGNLSIYRVPLFNNLLPLKALQFWIKLPAYFNRLDSSFKFDIVDFNSLSYWFLIKRLNNVPHFGTVHHLVKDAFNKNKSEHSIGLLNLSNENNFALRIIEKRYINSVDKIIAVSNYTKDKIIKYYNIDSRKIDVIYDGVALTKTVFSQDEISLYKKQLSLNNKPIILFVGRIDDPRKGLTFLLTAFKQVLQSYDSTLLVVGTGDQSKIKEIANEYGIESNIYFTGYVSDSDLKKIYQLCDVYVIPSRLEGFGLTILEAMSAGKPIVATNVGAISELIKDDVNGILIEPDDVRGMAEAIIKFISDVNYSQRIGKINKEHVTDEFGWDHSAKQVEDLFKEVSGIK